MLYPLLKSKPNYQALAALVCVALSGCVTKGSSFDHMHKQEAARYNVVLGMRYLDRDKPDLAKKKLLKANHQSPKDPLAIDAMAYYYESTGELAKAGKLYQKALSVAPDSPEAANNYGTYLCRHGQRQKAMDYFNQAARSPKYLNTAQAYENAGACLEQHGQDAKAEQYYQKSLKSAPNRPSTLLRLLRLSYNNKRYQQANGFLKRLKAHWPSLPQLQQWEDRLNQKQN